MVTAQVNLKTAPRCTFCPAGCRLSLSQAGPDNWKSEYPTEGGGGLCPRGSVVGELLGHSGRILWPARRGEGRRGPSDLASALKAIAGAADGREMVLLLDGNVSCEQMASAAAACSGWPQARLCLVVEPADHQLLLGAEASGAEYLSDEALKDCDGFVMIGDVFAANPMCSRGVFDRRKAEPRTPIVAIDSAAGSAAKFATHRVAVEPGMELSALQAVAAAAGADVGGEGWDAPAGSPSAAVAGAAIAGCQRLAVIVAAEHGRTASWRQLGFAAGRLANALGGGIAPQTNGANALVAVRLAERLNTISLAEALSGEDQLRVAIGADVLGMLGRDDLEVFAAAAALPNRTTEHAQIVLPLAMSAELGGTYLLSGARKAQVAALVRPPAGVPSPAELVGALASAAGAAGPRTVPGLPDLSRLSAGAPSPAIAQSDPGGKLLLGRQSIHAGCGELTAHGSWQRAVQRLPELRICPQDAREAGIKNLTVVTVRANGQSVHARVRISPELQAGRFVLPEGSAEARRLVGGQIDLAGESLAGEPVAVEVSA